MNSNRLPKHLVNKIMTYYIWFCQQDRPDNYLDELKEQSVKTLNPHMLTTVYDKTWLIVSNCPTAKDTCMGCNCPVEQCRTRMVHPHDCMGPTNRVMLVSTSKCYQCNKPRGDCDHFKAHCCDHYGFSDSNHQLSKYTHSKPTWERRMFDAVPPCPFHNKHPPVVFSHDEKDWAILRHFILLVSNDTCYGCQLPRQQCRRFIACNVDHYGFTQPRQFKKLYNKTGWLNSYRLPCLPKVVFPKENLCNVVQRHLGGLDNECEPIDSYYYLSKDASHHDEEHHAFYCARPDGKCCCGRVREECPCFLNHGKDCQGFSSIYEHNADKDNY